MRKKLQLDNVILHTEVWDCNCIKIQIGIKQLLCTFHFRICSSEMDINVTILELASRRGRVQSSFAYQAGSTRSNRTAAQVSNPLQSALHYLHEGYLGR